MVLHRQPSRGLLSGGSLTVSGGVKVKSWDRSLWPTKEATLIMVKLWRPESGQSSSCFGKMTCSCQPLSSRAVLLLGLNE